MMESAPASPARTPKRTIHAAMWFGLLGVPLVWAGHVLVCTGLVAIACAGGVAQRNALPWSVTHWLLALVSAAACALSCAGILAARASWQKTATLPAPRRETFRFVAWCSTAVSIAFTLGLVFTMAVLITLPLQRICEALR